jgi:arylsulfatase A-like enzyme
MAIRPPDVVLIVIDTLRADRLGAWGQKRPLTPRLDRLASKATVFERAYTHSPWTKPSVASILTGLEPKEHGVHQWEDELPAEVETLAESFRRAGYETAGMVSHVLLVEEEGFAQGFEAYASVSLEDLSPHQKISAPEVADFGIRKIQAGRTRPLFLFLHFFDPHMAYLEHPKFEFGDSEVDRYDGEVAFVDHHVGRFLRALSKAGRLERALVAVVADHGEEFLEHGGTQHTVTLYDEVLHVPLMIRVPGFEARRVPGVVAETQLAPTLLALAGLEIPASVKAPPLPFDGEGFLAGEGRPLYAETRRAADREAIVEAGWKLVRNRRNGSMELYERVSDPGERHNLIGNPVGRRDFERLRQSLDVASSPTPRSSSRILREDQVRALEALGYVIGDEGRGRQGTRE